MNHYPVMLREVIEGLALQNKKIVVDCTFGAGGYTRAILESSEASVIAIDQDPDAIIRSEDIKTKFKNRFQIFKSSFSNIKEVLKDAKVDKVDAIVLDIGVSSFQLDDAARGFSFMSKGPLDMRMSKLGITAKDIIETYTEEQLATIFKEYGEERHSKLIARKIKEEIESGVEFKTTLDLSGFISRLIKGSRKIHPATRVFQALRIEVNQELEELKKVIEDSLELLNVGGRLVVVSFHSLEDKIVKEKFKKTTGKRKHLNKYAKDSDLDENSKEVKFISIGSKFLVPSEEELKENIRSRSAKMRIIERVS
ncbi:MAG: 16S rRNA (cytosine(1402)-N(4))-methyltransferase RsmH [Proteobacteria bacterium]|nr:16S rRNA (cytosine(1402)-N(4))-methyltransferase RsmH [Pseudomonadota bacterium]